MATTTLPEYWNQRNETCVNDHQARRDQARRHEVRLFLRRRQGRWQRQDEGRSRRQRRGPRRDDQCRIARASRLHHSDRSLPRIHAPGKCRKKSTRQMEEALAQLEALQGQKLGKGDNPLLVSVRSGAKFSMPGMMDTILNLGLNDQSVEALAKRTQQSALRLRLLSPSDSDVRQRRA